MEHGCRARPDDRESPPPRSVGPPAPAVVRCGYRGRPPSPPRRARGRQRWSSSHGGVPEAAALIAGAVVPTISRLVPLPAWRAGATRLREVEPGDLVVDHATLYVRDEVGRDETARAREVAGARSHFPHDRSVHPTVEGTGADGTAADRLEGERAESAVDDDARLDEAAVGETLYRRVEHGDFASHVLYPRVDGGGLHHGSQMLARRRGSRVPCRRRGAARSRR